MTPEQLARRNAAVAEGQRRAWTDPDIRARRSAAIRAAMDDPLYLAHQRAVQRAARASQMTGRTHGERNR